MTFVTYPIKVECLNKNKFEIGTKALLDVLEAKYIFLDIVMVMCPLGCKIDLHS